MARRLREDARAMLHAAAFGVACAIVEAPDARKRDGCCAHRAWLECDVETESDKPF